MLSDKVRVLLPDDAIAPEDFFSSALSTVFPDDTRNAHGDPGATVVYTSTRFGDISLTVAEPDSEQDRKLFAHYLWNAAVYIAERISSDVEWSVESEDVLELGAGLGLAGIVSCLCDARSVVMTDYPSPSLLENIARDLRSNVAPPQHTLATIEGHQWGDLDTPFARAHQHKFTRILSADCLWMPWEHANLARSMRYFLSPDPISRVYVVAGFHTGRAKVVPFFAAAKAEGFEVEELYEEDIDGVRRPWADERDGGRENVTERKRWLVVAVLKLPTPS